MKGNKDLKFLLTYLTFLHGKANCTHIHMIVMCDLQCMHHPYDLYQDFEPWFKKSCANCRSSTTLVYVGKLQRHLHSTILELIFEPYTTLYTTTRMKQSCCVNRPAYMYLLFLTKYTVTLIASSLLTCASGDENTSSILNCTAMGLESWTELPKDLI